MPTTGVTGAPGRATMALDEVCLTMHGARHELWQAVNQDGHGLDMGVPRRRNTHAAKQCFRKLLCLEARSGSVRGHPQREADTPRRVYGLPPGYQESAETFHHGPAGEGCLLVALDHRVGVEGSHEGLPHRRVGDR